MKSRRTPLTLVVGLFLLLINLPALAADAPLKVVASFTVLADIVRNVGGERVQVDSLIGVNGDPHAYEPTPKDAQTLKEADLVFVNGLGLEGWMDRLIEASGFSGQPVVVTDGIRTRQMDEDGTRITDPHAWNDPRNVRRFVQTIQQALAEVDPAGKAVYARNARQYDQQLQDLDRYARERIAGIPATRRIVLTAHDAFGYLGDAYGIRLLAPLGLSTESEASAQDMARLIQQIRQSHLRSYFIENSNDPRLVRQIAEATGAQPGGELYAEALSAADGPAPTYLRMLRYDIDRMVAGMSAQ